LVLVILEAVGIVAFAYAGAVRAVRARLDVFGVVVSATVTAIGGGVIRDVLLGVHPPVGMLTWWYLVTSTIVALTVFFGYSMAVRVSAAVQYADAVGLAMFTVAGASKALTFGAPWYAAAMVGMINAVGGGMVVETMLRRTPTVLRKDIYALPALGGGVAVAAGTAAAVPSTPLTLAVVALVVTVRVLAVRFDWHLAVGRPHPELKDSGLDTAETIRFLPTAREPWTERTIELPRIRTADPPGSDTVPERACR
jgi:uncharacterized membrane protein YeiH